MNSIFYSLLLLYFTFPSSSADEYSDFRMRKKFHEIFCERRPTLSTCNGPFTIQDYRQELLRQKGTEQQEIADDATTETANFQVSRRADAVDDDLDDRDFEYYMWRKRRRQMLRRRMQQYDRESSGSGYDPEYHYHYHEAPRYNYRPYYPRYSSYYPSYGGYGGYGGTGYGGGYGGYGGGFGGGLLGGLFGIGIGRSIGISTPIGGFGYQSGFGIGIG